MIRLANTKEKPFGTVRTEINHFLHLKDTPNR